MSQSNNDTDDGNIAIYEYMNTAKQLILGIFCKPIDSMLWQSIESMGLQKIFISMQETLANLASNTKISCMLSLQKSDGEIYNGIWHAYIDI